jgi:hypothetical protein
VQSEKPGSPDPPPTAPYSVGWRHNSLQTLGDSPGVSAGMPLASRPAGSRLLTAAKKNKSNVVAKLDRLFRSAC